MIYFPFKFISAGLRFDSSEEDYSTLVLFNMENILGEIGVAEKK